MFSLIKFFIYFTLSFLILSFPIGNKKIFFHLAQITNPFTETIFLNLRHTLKDNLSLGKKVGHEIYSKTLTNIQENSQKMIQRGPQTLQKFKKEDFENITAEEREMLKRILSQSRY